VQKNNIETVKLLIGLGANTNLVNSFGHNAIFAAVSHTNNEIVQILIDHGGNINQQNNSGCAPIMNVLYCRGSGSFTVKTLKLLKILVKKADLTIKNNNEKTIFDAVNEQIDYGEIKYFF
jgi:ankyrin repeat protein